MTMTDSRRLIATGKTSAFQIQAILVCQLINMLDGFDVVVASYTAPVIAAQHGASAEWIGLFISASLLGMTAGSLVLAPLADIIGRRFTIIGGMLTISAGMFLTGLAETTDHLLASRALTGLGIGLLFASLTTIVVEYSTDRRRDLAVSIFYLGYPIGATIGGLLTAYHLEQGGDWQTVYFAGGLAGFAVLAAVLVWLPESIEYLAVRQPAGALERINRLLSRMGRPALDALPPPPQPGQASRVGALFAGGQWRGTLALWIAFGTSMLSVYFLIGWTPTVLIDAGLSTSQGVIGGVILNAGGGAGMLLLGALAARISLQRLIGVYFLAGAAAMAAFGIVADGGELVVLSILLFIMGFFTYGALIGLYALATRVYPARVRATGVGWSIGVGRMGSIAGPTLAGVLIGLGWDRMAYFLVLATPLLLGAFAVSLVRTSTDDK
jgi:benzoate transport